MDAPLHSLMVKCLSTAVGVRTLEMLYPEVRLLDRVRHLIFCFNYFCLLRITYPDPQSIYVQAELVSALFAFVLLGEPFP